MMDGMQDKELVYISGPLQAVKNVASARKFYEQIAEVCARRGFKTYLPHQFTDPVKHRHISSKKVFSRDLKSLSDADVIIACIGRPSSGVGAEVGIAFERGMRIIAIYSQKEQPSRFILGMLQTAKNSQVICYASMTECRTLLDGALTSS